MLPSFRSKELVIHSKRSVSPVPSTTMWIFPPLVTDEGLPVGSVSCSIPKSTDKMLRSFPATFNFALNDIVF